MKKLFAILAVGTVLVACNNATDSSAAKAADSLSKQVDTLSAKVDSVAAAAKDSMHAVVDTLKAKVDSVKK